MECTRCFEIKELVKGRWCKECKNKYEVERRKKNREGINKKERARYHKTKDKISNVPLKIYTNAYKTCSVCNESKTQDNFHVHKVKNTLRSMCKSCSSKKRKEYYIENKDAICKQTSEYKQHKIDTNFNFKMECRLRQRMYVALKTQTTSKNKRSFKYLDCSAHFFQEWIKYNLYDGMTLENYGDYWHLDHVKPVSKYNLQDESQKCECFCWKNIRPYKASKNRMKSNKIIKTDELFQELKVKCFLNYNNRRSEKSPAKSN